MLLLLNIFLGLVAILTYNCAKNAYHENKYIKMATIVLIGICLIVVTGIAKEYGKKEVRKSVLTNAKTNFRSDNSVPTWTLVLDGNETKYYQRKPEEESALYIDNKSVKKVGNVYYFIGKEVLLDGRYVLTYGEYDEKNMTVHVTAERAYSKEGILINEMNHSDDKYLPIDHGGYPYIIFRAVKLAYLENN